MTPARGRELAAAAADLYRQLREADIARDAEPDPARRRAGWRLDVAAGGLRSAARSYWTPLTNSSGWPSGRPTRVPCRGASAPSTARRSARREGVAGAPRPVAFGV